MLPPDARRQPDPQRTDPIGAKNLQREKAPPPSKNNCDTTTWFGRHSVVAAVNGNWLQLSDIWYYVVSALCICSNLREKYGTTEISINCFANRRQKSIIIETYCQLKACSIMGS